MVKRQALLAVSCLALLLLLAAPGLVRADDPTPTYTVTPWPIPTRAHQFLRPTPSPFQVTPGGASLDIQGDTKAGELADTIINGYRFLNFGSTSEHGGVIDLILFIAMGFLIFQAIMALIDSTSEGG